MKRVKVRLATARKKTGESGGWWYTVPSMASCLLCETCLRNRGSYRVMGIVGGIKVYVQRHLRGE
jgi:hypothetical protein